MAAIWHVKKQYYSRLQEVVSLISVNPAVQGMSPKERHSYREYIVLQ